MTRRNLIWSLALGASLVFSASLYAQDAHPMARNVAQMKLVNFPGMPTCGTGSVENGDPSKGPSIIYAKMNAGCVFPWHWHTPVERLMIVSGTAIAEPKDGKAFTLHAGAFVLMPSRHIHRFSCPSGCTLYVDSDMPFDMHYVDKQGNEISPEVALKAVKETPAKPPAM